MTDDIVHDCPVEQWIGHEIRGVYDGVLFWSCARCGEVWNRWHVDHPRWDRAEHYIAIYRAGQESVR